MKIIYCTRGYNFNILGVVDNDKDIKKIIRPYIAEMYDYYKKRYGDDLSLAEIMRDTVDLINDIVIEEIELNKYNLLEHYCGD
jgi:hypothetical protein